MTIPLLAVTSQDGFRPRTLFPRREGMKVPALERGASNEDRERSRLRKDIPGAHPSLRPNGPKPLPLQALGPCLKAQGTSFRVQGLSQDISPVSVLKYEFIFFIFMPMDWSNFVINAPYQLRLS